VRHASAKYGKFCYSTQFGFSLPSAPDTLHGGAYDSTLALGENGDGCYRARIESDAVEISSTRVVSHWRPWPDVLVTTWLVPMPPWHVRVHRVRTARSLKGAEGGFAVGLGPDEPDARHWSREWPGDWVGVRTERGVSAIVNLCGERSGEAVRADPNTNVLCSRTVIPTLHARLTPGEHWLACAVVATCAIETAERLFVVRPAFRLTTHGFDVRDQRGRLVLSELCGTSASWREA
jgi:hypothetical protein